MILKLNAMKKNCTLLFFFYISFQLSAQIQGTVNNSKNEPLAYVSVYLENTHIGTTSNELGLYELNISKKGKHTIIFQYLGYKTLKKIVEIDTFPYQLNISLEEENVLLNEVVINSKKNLANRIIRKVIENRKHYLEKITAYTSDFYSKGLFRIKNAPEKIFGQDIGDLGGGLDSTRSGVIYLSETVSKLFYKQPNSFKERILASKVSGNNSGFSYNQASDVNFNFYKNTIDIESKIVSPIASYAFNYYNYKLIGTFFEGKHLINKISIHPKRKTDNAFSGTIYIVEDDWAIYGLDLSITGKQMGQPVLDKLTLRHSYSYSKNEQYWPLISQLISFKFGMLGIHVDGQYTTGYSNYNFDPQFKENEFNNEVLSFEENSNKKDSVFWNSTRPVILTEEEKNDYKIKDSIQILKKSKKYLDSIDRKNNTLKISNVLFGYSFRNSHKDWSLNFSSALSGTQFNTVQGLNPSMDITYFTHNKDKGSRFMVQSNLNYGFSDRKWKATGKINYIFNSFSRPFLQISGGKKISQFNESEPISPMLNSATSLLFEDNYAKFYDKTFAEIYFSDELINGVRIQSSLGYEKRSPLVNTTDYVLLNDKQKIYTSNDPLNETNYNIPSFDEHSVYTFSTTANIRFGQNYISYPDKKINIESSVYPILTLFYNQNFASNENKYNFSEIGAKLVQNLDFDNKGSFKYNIKAGTFFKAEDISFIDYKHFNGNQTHISVSNNYTNAFNLMSYYNFSTHKSYAEFHAEHHFNGFILNKIPGIRNLSLKLVIGGHTLLTKDNKPYSEFSLGLENIGIGKLRFLRLDYVQSYHNGIRQDGLIFGLNF